MNKAQLQEGVEDQTSFMAGLSPYTPTCGTATIALDGSISLIEIPQEDKIFLISCS